MYPSNYINRKNTPDGHSKEYEAQYENFYHEDEPINYEAENRPHHSSPGIDRHRPEIDRHKPGRDIHDRRNRINPRRPSSPRFHRDNRRPSGRPPLYIPRRNDRGPKVIDHASMLTCRGNYTYVWLKNAQSFWMYVTDISRRSLSGYRWSNFGWAYANYDLNYIDNFACSPY